MKAKEVNLGQYLYSRYVPDMHGLQSSAFSIKLYSLIHGQVYFYKLCQVDTNNYNILVTDGKGHIYVYDTYGHYRFDDGDLATTTDCVMFLDTESDEPKNLVGKLVALKADKATEFIGILNYDGVTYAEFLYGIDIANKKLSITPISISKLRRDSIVEVQSTKLTDLMEFDDLLNVNGFMRDPDTNKIRPVTVSEAKSLKLFEPYCKVLVRSHSDHEWRLGLFEDYGEKYFRCISYKSQNDICIPYNDYTKDLLL